MLRRVTLAGLVALLVGGAACAETPDATEDDSIEAVQTRANAGDAEAPDATEDDSIEAVQTHANAEDAEAQHNLGLLYFNGEGVPPDAVEAVLWFRKAAEQGYGAAQAALGLMYRSGIGGVPQDEVEAYKWFSLAATYANDEMRERSVEVRDLVAERLTPEQLAEGQRRVREWFEAHPSEP